MALFGESSLDFGPDTPVLRGPARRDRHSKWVLWPVYGWRVVAPVPAERKLNLFQRTVLDFARAQVTRADVLSERMGVAPQLIALIVSELRTMDLLDHAGLPTEAGRLLLEEEAAEALDEAQVGYVLSDALTGKLWPRFLTGDLPFAEVIYDERKRAILLNGSAGDPWRDRTFTIRAATGEGLVPERPDPTAILRAARGHQRERDHHESNDAQDRIRLQRVSFIHDQPQPYLVALRVHGLEKGELRVDHPFDGKDSLRMRARLEERLDRQNGLRKWLAPEQQVDGEPPTLHHLHTAATWRVEEALTAAIQDHDSIRTRLIAMQRAALEAESAAIAADRWNDVLVNAQGAVEDTLQQVHRPYRRSKPSYSWEFKNEPKRLRAYVKESAQIVGFADVPDRLLSVQPPQVADAERGKGSLRGWLVLTLLAARWDEDHPLRRAQLSAPDLLHRLDALATARNDAAHAGRRAQVDDIQPHIDSTYAAVHALLLQR